MFRTNYPKFILNIKTQAQRNEWERKCQLASSCNPKRQRLVFKGQDKKTGDILFHNFFVHTSEIDGKRYWKGYSFVIRRDGSVVCDKGWKTRKGIDGKLYLVRPEVVASQQKITL